MITFSKNYETAAKFVKVMPRILWPLFIRTRCILTLQWVRIHMLACIHALHCAPMCLLVQPV